MVKNWRHFGLLILVAPWLGCRPAAEPGGVPQPHRCQVYTTSYPLFYIAQRLAGDHADVQFPAPSGEDPAFWRPSADIVRRYQQADLILANGADFEKWADTTSLPYNTFIDTSAGFKNQWLSFPEQITHSHGPQGPHSHGNIDFNTWLDPLLAGRQAEVVQQALRERGMVPEPELQQRSRQLNQDLLELDQKFRDVSRQLSGQPLLASHPVYGYLAREYHWKLQSVHWEPGEPVSEAQWQAFDALLARHAARWMLWEAEPRPEVRAHLQARGVQPVVFQTCGNRPESGDYLQAMQRNLAALRQALK